MRMCVEDETAVWEYEAGCSVCMEPWTEEGRHQSCSLACGHTFGRSCIEKWISGCKKNICPKCKKRCKLSDIRPIYPKRVAVIDKVLEKELEISRAENRLLEMEKLKECAKKWFEEFDTNDVWVLEEDFTQLTLEEDEILRKEEEIRRQEASRGCRPQQVNNEEFNINWDEFEDELGGGGGQNEDEDAWLSYALK